MEPPELGGLGDAGRCAVPSAEVGIVKSSKSCLDKNAATRFAADRRFGVILPSIRVRALVSLYKYYKK